MPRDFIEEWFASPPPPIQRGYSAAFALGSATEASFKSATRNAVDMLLSGKKVTCDELEERGILYIFYAEGEGFKCRLRNNSTIIASGNVFAYKSYRKYENRVEDYIDAYKKFKLGGTC